MAIAEAAGWRYDQTSKGHPRLRPPKGSTIRDRSGQIIGQITFSKTPSDWRADMNTLAELRRAGLDV